MSDVVSERSDGILRVELNRPAKRNAMTGAMYLALARIFDDAAGDSQTRVVLWHGAGDAFCAGNDIEDFLKNPPGPGESPQATLMHALVDFDKPIVAAVHGSAIGGGTTMLTHCDFVYAAEGTKFQLPFVNLALVPEFGSSFSLPQTAGYLRAAELVLLGSPFDAQHAQTIGLVTRVLPRQDLLATATDTAAKLAAKPPSALRAGKRLMRRNTVGRVKAAMEAENKEFSVQVRSCDAREALNAFLEKRAPHFSEAAQ